MSVVPPTRPTRPGRACDSRKSRLEVSRTRMISFMAQRDNGLHGHCHRRGLGWLGEQDFDLATRFVHLRVADLAVAADPFDATQCLDVVVIAGAIVVLEVLDETDIPIAKFTFAAMPLRHGATQPAEMLQQVQLPLFWAEFESEVAAKDVEFGTIQMMVNDLVAALLVDMITMVIAAGLFLAGQQVRH